MLLLGFMLAMLFFEWSRRAERAAEDAPKPPAQRPPKSAVERYRHVLRSVVGRAYLGGLQKGLGVTLPLQSYRHHLAAGSRIVDEVAKQAETVAARAWSDGVTRTREALRRTSAIDDLVLDQAVALALEDDLRDDAHSERART